MQNATFDSSFWINAHRSGLWPYVLARYDLRYPPPVSAELKESFPSGQHFWRLVREGVLAEDLPESTHVQGFGSGERAAMELTLEHREWILLIDDHRPFQEAARLGLKALCSPVPVVGSSARGRSRPDKRCTFWPTWRRSRH